MFLAISNEDTSSGQRLVNLSEIHSCTDVGYLLECYGLTKVVVGVAGGSANEVATLGRDTHTINIHMGHLHLMEIAK